MAKRDSWSERKKEVERKRNRERRAGDRRTLDPSLPPYRPRVPRGPMGKPPSPLLADGLELAGQSIRSDGQGNVSSVWDLGRRAGPEPAPLPHGVEVPTHVSVATRGDGTEVMRWTSFNREEADRHASLMSAWDRHAEAYDGYVEPAPAPASANENLVQLYPIGDYHLGLLAWFRECGVSWDLKHGKAALSLAVAELVRAAPDAERAIIVNLGDFLHAQDDANATPGHGNKLDVDGRHAKVADAALALLVAVIDTALRKHRHVTVRNLPGNHDPRVAAGLARELRAWYRNEPRITIADAYALHQYDVIGKVLLGFHHGHTTPLSELPGIMATDMPEAWGTTLYRYWHRGHEHHKSRVSEKEYPGVVTETHRILPPGDAWHRGRYRAGRSMCAITYDRDFGEVGRVTIPIERIQAALSREVA